MRTAIDAPVATDVHFFRVGGARVHADLAANDEARVVLAHEPERDAVARVGTHAGTDRGGAGRERQEALARGEIVAIPDRGGDLLGRDVPPVNSVHDAQGD